MQGGSEAGGRYRRLELGSALLLQQRAATQAEEGRRWQRVVFLYHRMAQIQRPTKQPNAIAGLEALLVESSRSGGSS